MALTPFPSSVGWDKIRTHGLSIVNLVCYPLDQAFAHQMKSLIFSIPLSSHLKGCLSCFKSVSINSNDGWKIKRDVSIVDAFWRRILKNRILDFFIWKQVRQQQDQNMIKILFLSDFWKKDLISKMLLYTLSYSYVFVHYKGSILKLRIGKFQFW